MLVSIGPWLLDTVEGLYTREDVEAFLLQSTNEDDKRTLEEILNYLPPSHQR